MGITYCFTLDDMYTQRSNDNEVRLSIIILITHYTITIIVSVSGEWDLGSPYVHVCFLLPLREKVSCCHYLQDMVMAATSDHSHNALKI